MTSTEYVLFRSHYNIFKWFRNQRWANQEALASIRASRKSQQPAHWSNLMHRCRHCKKRMQIQITYMEQIVRPYSRYLQEKHSCN